MYKDVNDLNTLLNKPLFIPTTIMELSNFSKYAFVINNMYFNSHKCLVYIVSTKEINNKNTSSKKLTHIPCGKFKHVRFDVDDYQPPRSRTKWFSGFDNKLSEYWSDLRGQCSKDEETTKYKGNPLCPIPLLAEKCSDIIISESKPCFTDYYKDDGIMPKGFVNLFADIYESAKIN